MDTSKTSKCNGKLAWPEAQSIRQQFSLPDSITFYMAKNPSTSKCYLKLAQSCKYFFEKFPLIIVAPIFDDGKMICSNNFFTCKNKPRNSNQKCCIKIDFAKLLSKVWLTGELFLDQSNENIASLLLSRFYRCEKTLNLSDARGDWKNFKFYAPKFQHFDFYNVHMTYNDGSTVMLESILEAIPKIKKFVYYFDHQTPSATTTTMKNISLLKNFDNLCLFRLLRIPEIFSVEDIAEFITNRKNTKIRLYFIANLISAEYNNQLDQYNSVTKKELRDYL